MELDKLSKEIDKIPKKQKVAILKIIDIKTNNDMREVINKLEAQQQKSDSQHRIMLWVIGASVFVLGTIMAVLGLK